MLVNRIEQRNNQYACPKRNRQEPSFKQVTPDHFFIKMRGYSQNREWGQYIVNLVNMNKLTIMNKNSNLETVLYRIGENYSNFKPNIIIKNSHEDKDKLYIRVLKKILNNINRLLSGKTGVKKRFYNLDLVGLVRKDEKEKYSEYYEVIKNKLVENKHNLKPSQKLIFAKTKFGKNFMPFPKFIKLNTWQVQDKIDGKNIILTRMAYLPNKINEEILCFVHPPLKSRKPILNYAQRVFESLKSSNSKNLTNDEIAEKYKKIGEIHWCLAQSMPFCHGSAGIADTFIKSLFEALNIQVQPWKKGIAPDIEAFLTPMNEFSKKYQTFFDNQI